LQSFPTRSSSDLEQSKLKKRNPIQSGYYEQDELTEDKVDTELEAATQEITEDEHHTPINIQKKDSEHNIVTEHRPKKANLDTDVPYNVMRNRQRSEEHTSNSSHVSISYAVFCLKKK